MKKRNNPFTQNKRLTWILTLCLAFIIGALPCFLLFGSVGNQSPAVSTLSAADKPILTHKITNPASDSSSGETPEYHTVFKNLAANANYVFALVADEKTSQMLADNNLFYVDQEKSDENGLLSFDYIPRTYRKATVCLFGENSSDMTELTWILSENELSVGGNGSIGTYENPNQAPWYADRSNIRSVSIQKGVTKIGTLAFGNCSSLQSVSISDTVTAIDENAFKGCSQIKELTIPGSVTEIADNAFPKNSSIIIKGTAGSAAEEYAAANNIPFVDISTPPVLLGDVDSDNTVSIFDATAIQRWLAELPSSSFNEAVADADEDGGVTIFDATAIQRWLANLPSNNNIGNPI